jgi:hypothetical protein
MSDNGPINPRPGPHPSPGIKRVLAALAAGIAGLGAALAVPAPAQAAWSELTPGRVGFWTRSFGDPYEDGRFGAYRTPPDNGPLGVVLPDWLDYPRSLWNRDGEMSIWVYENPTCNSSGGRWVRELRPGQKVNSTAGTDWDSIQAFSFLAPTPSRRSCT